MVLKTDILSVIGNNMIIKQNKTNLKNTIEII